MLGDGLAAFTSACVSRLALDQMMTESLPLYVLLITSIHIHTEYKDALNISSFHYIDYLRESLEKI